MSESCPFCTALKNNSFVLDGNFVCIIDYQNFGKIAILKQHAMNLDQQTYEEAMTLLGKGLFTEMNDVTGHLALRRIDASWLDSAKSSAYNTNPKVS